MSHSSSTQSTGTGPEFNLPDDILSVIPTDPYDQLDLARKITSMAIASRVSKLESEVGRLKQKVYEKDNMILELEEKVSHLQQAFHEADMRFKISREDNVCPLFSCSVIFVLFLCPIFDFGGIRLMNEY